MEDEFFDRYVGLDSPASNALVGDEAIKSDTVDLEQPTRGLSFAAAGDLKVKTLGGQTLTFPNGALAPGIIHGLRVLRVFDTGTAATGLVLYW